MRRSVIFPVLVILFAAAFWWFSRQRPGATSQPRTPATASIAGAAAPADAKRADHVALFGDEAAAADIQWRDSGLGYRIIKEGTPPKPGIGTAVRIQYTGRLMDGTVFDKSAQPTEFLIGATIPGLSTGLQMLGTGGKAVFFIPPSLGYGNRKVMGIPAGSGLIFDVEVVEVKS